MRITQWIINWNSCSQKIWNHILLTSPPTKKATDIIIVTNLLTKDVLNVHYSETDTNKTHTLWCNPWMPKCNVISKGQLSGGCRWNNQRWIVYSMRGHRSKPKTVEHTTHDPTEMSSKEKPNILYNYIRQT